MKKTHRYINHLSIFLILGSYVASPIQITAQEVLEQELISEQVLEEPQQIDNESYHEVQEADNSVELGQKDVSDLTPEMSDNKDEIVDIAEVLVEDPEDAFDVAVYSTDGYSHVESLPGVVVVTTPSDATMETLATYLEDYFQSTAIRSLTIHGMIDTGTNDNSDQSFGLSTFTGLSYLEMVDLESVGISSLMNLSNLNEIYLPKVKSIGAMAFWMTDSLIKFNAPLVEEVGMNAFFGVPNLEVLIAPNWNDIDTSSLGLDIMGGSSSVKEISTGTFSSTTSIDYFSNLEKQTVNTTNGSLIQNTNYIIFPGVRELTVTGATSLYARAFRGYPESIKYLSSDTLTVANLTDFVNLESIDFDERLTSIWPNAFRGTKIETLRLSNLVFNLHETSFAGAEYLREVYLPRVNIAYLPDTLNLPNSLEIIGTTSDRLGSFQGIANDNPSVLFAATESNESLPLEDKQIIIGETEILETDLSNYILNEDLSQTAFEVTKDWFFEGVLIGTSDTYAISNMNQSNVGAYHYSVNLTPKGNGTYSGSRESRRAQIDIVNEIHFDPDFSVSSVVGELQDLEISFTSNVTNISSSFQIVVPESLKIDDENIEIYLDNFSSSLPLRATVTVEDRVITVSNFALLVGFNYHIDIPIMPIAVSEQTDEIQVEFRGGFDPVKVTGDVMITQGEFNVSIPSQIDFEEVSLDFSSIQSSIKKVNPLDIDITSFTAQEESWEIMVSATPFVRTDNLEVDEDSLRLIYKENGYMFNLSEEISMASGSFSGQLDYDFRTDTWENHSYVLTQLEEEGFHVIVGNEYYKLESQQVYTTELNFTIQYSP